MSEDLQQTFIKEIQETKCLTVCLGQRKSGKSVWSLCVLREAIKQRGFKAWYLVIPSFNKEQNNQYDFLNIELKKLKQEGHEVIIFSELNELVLDMIREKQHKNGGVDALFLVDDSTAFISKYVRTNNENMNRMLTELRHKDLNMSVYMVVHSLKGILSPLFREMLTFLFVFDCTTKNTLDAIYEEYYSVKFDTFKEWKKTVWMPHCEESRQYTPLCFYTLQGGKYDLETKNWGIYRRNKNFILNQKGHQDKTK
jgi:hypothetical protein